MARKDIDLSSKTIKILQKLADQDKRKLKAYMQKVLEDYAENQPTFNQKGAQARWWRE